MASEAFVIIGVVPQAEKKKLINYCARVWERMPKGPGYLKW